MRARSSQISEVLVCILICSGKWWSDGVVSFPDGRLFPVILPEQLRAAGRASGEPAMPYQFGGP
eukprot:11193638-Lingulodinium_polyedra.AAC.1